MKKHYLLLAGLSCMNIAFAQPTLNASDINPTMGETMSMVNGSYVPEGNGGNNVTWDLSGIVSTLPYNLVTGAPNASTPNANIEYDFVGSSKMYQFNDATRQDIYYQLAGPTLITFSNPMKYLEFPLNMSTTFQDNFTATFSSSGYNFVRQGTVDFVTDGYGTLITPAGTFTNVIRAVVTQTYTDTYSLGTIDYEVTSYVWYKAGYHYALASCVTAETFQGTNQYSEYMQTLPVSVDELVGDIANVYPNPVSDDLTINFKNQPAKKYELYTLTGQLVVSSSKELQLNESVDMSSFDSGVYILKFINADNRITTIKVVKK